jgi:hypothetical protein
MYLSTDGYYDLEFEDTWYCPDDRGCRLLFHTNVVRGENESPLVTPGKWAAKDERAFEKVFGDCLVIWDERKV